MAAVAREHGRAESLIIFDENEGFNSLTHEMARQGLAGNGRHGMPHAGSGGREAPSPTASKQAGMRPYGKTASANAPLYPAGPLCGQGSLTVADIIRFINAAPPSTKDVTNPEWQKGSFMYTVMDAAMRQPKVPLPKRRMTNMINFWAEAYPAIPEKTRGNIAITVTTALDRFKHGRLTRVILRARPR